MRDHSSFLTICVCVCLCGRRFCDWPQTSHNSYFGTDRCSSSEKIFTRMVHGDLSQDWPWQESLRAIHGTIWFEFQFIHRWYSGGNTFFCVRQNTLLKITAKLIVVGLCDSNKLIIYAQKKNDLMMMTYVWYFNTRIIVHTHSAFVSLNQIRWPLLVTAIFRIDSHCDVEIEFRF